MVDETIVDVGASDEDVVVVVVVEVVVDEDVVLVKPGSVETMAPRPLRTVPLFSAQQVGSLSQQKLPSEQFSARGKRPVPGSARVAISGHVHTHNWVLPGSGSGHAPY